ncbi:efflux transporter outer membrane subunit [Legionella sp. km772]|nr:efflux transporter outer membrane subunit [Legionella sp. km772]
MQTACMVGPNFKSPPSPRVHKYTETPLAKKTAAVPASGGAAQTFRQDKDIPLLWWELFHSKQINQLIKMGLINSPNLAAASAALKKAQQNWKAQIGSSLLPAVDGAFGIERQQYSTVQIGQNSSSTFNLFNPLINVSYTFDFFGQARRQIESLKAQVDYQQFQLIAAQLTLTSNIVTSSITVASYRAQIQATKKLIKVEQDILDILHKQYKIGGVSKENILTQISTLEQTKALLPPLELSLSQTKHTLSALVGGFPEQALPEIELESLHLPTDLPLTMPSRLVRQRPDIRAAEALLHSACAEIGVATAQLFPQVTLTGNEGWLSNTWQNLFTSTNNVWSLGLQVAQPIFKGNSLRAQRRAAIANFQEFAAQYKQTVLEAFQNVADVLKAIEQDALLYKIEVKADNAARASLELAIQQYRLGGVDYLSLLNAQQQYLTVHLKRINVQATRYQDSAALFQALGGGWWQKPACIQPCS